MGGVGPVPTDWSGLGWAREQEQFEVLPVPRLVCFTVLSALPLALPGCAALMLLGPSLET